MAVNSFPESSVSELEVLESLIPLASKWNSIGLMLGLSNGELDTIKADCGGAEECLKKVLQKLYDRTPHPTWEVVIAALRSPLMKESALAEKLEKQMVRLEATPPETTPQGKELSRKIRSGVNFDPTGPFFAAITCPGLPKPVHPVTIACTKLPLLAMKMELYL